MEINDTEIHIMSGNKGNNRLLGNIASLGIVQIANYVFPLISVPIISRIIGPDKYGVINYAYSFTVYFSLLVSYGFDLTATRRLAANPDNKELRDVVFSEVLKAKCILFLFSTLIFSICLFTVEPLAKEKSVAIFSFFSVFSFVITQNWLFQAMQNLKKVAILNFVGKLLFTVFVLLIVREKKDYLWQPLIISISQIFVAVLSFLWAIKTYNIQIRNINIQRIIGLLKEEKTIFLSMLIVSFYTTTNTVMLGILRNDTEVGYFTAAGKLMDVLNSVINMPMAQALFPFVGMSFAKSKEDGIKTIQKITPVVFYFTLIASLISLTLGPYFLTIFYGKAFLPSIPVFQVMSFIPMIVAINNIFGVQTMLNLKMDKLFFNITCGGAILGVLLNIIMIHYWGYIGTAWNWLIVEVYITIAMYAVIKRKGIDPFDRKNFNILETFYFVKGLVIKKKNNNNR